MNLSPLWQVFLVTLLPKRAELMIGSSNNYEEESFNSG
ncbi:hypothetical protein J2Y60_004698 [Arcicella sp. BE140]|nr:hypothetical protein [Arcicella sp. BE140]MDR6825764.1 hypothetical protein [Arcicella sp. BE139]